MRPRRSSPATGSPASFSVTKPRSGSTRRFGVCVCGRGEKNHSRGKLPIPSKRLLENRLGQNWIWTACPVCPDESGQTGGGFGRDIAWAEPDGPTRRFVGAGVGAARVRLRIRISNSLRASLSGTVFFPVIETRFSPRFDYPDRGGKNEP